MSLKIKCLDIVLEKAQIGTPFCFYYILNQFSRKTCQENIDQVVNLALIEGFVKLYNDEKKLFILTKKGEKAKLKGGFKNYKLYNLKKNLISYNTITVIIAFLALIQSYYSNSSVKKNKNNLLDIVTSNDSLKDKVFILNKKIDSMRFFILHKDSLNKSQK